MEREGGLERRDNVEKDGVIERIIGCKEKKMPKKNSEQGKESKKGRTRKINSFSKEKQENRRTRKTKSKRKIKKHVRGIFFYIYSINFYLQYCTVYNIHYTLVQYSRGWHRLSKKYCTVIGAFYDNISNRSTSLTDR